MFMSVCDSIYVENMKSSLKKRRKEFLFILGAIKGKEEEANIYCEGKE